jgi:hypothetical protein
MRSASTARGGRAEEYGLQDVPSDQLMTRLREDVKEASGGLTAAMMKLTGEIQQHFPEVVLLIGKGLPSELAPLWRPSRSLDSFDQKELVAKNRQRIFRVCDGEAWFAIKEYDIEQASDLHTCFKEAAIIYQASAPQHSRNQWIKVRSVLLDAKGSAGVLQTSTFRSTPRSAQPVPS